MKKPDWYAWHNSLKPQGEGIEIDLSTLTCLILPGDATAIEVRAAEILNGYWEKITGRMLCSAVEGSGGDHLSGIWLGNTQKYSWLPLPEHDGVNIFCDGKNIVLRGGKGRGLVNAVFSLLNEDMGCRFYAADAEIIPYLKYAIIVNRNYSPQLKLRDPYYFTSFNADWSLRNRTNAPDAAVVPELGGHACYPGKDGHVWHGNTFFVHTYHQLLPPSIYFAAHPEYYQLNEDGERIAGQLCETNPVVQRIAAEKALSVLRENPHVNLIDISRIDGGGCCQCASCKALNAQEKSEAASMLALVNFVAEQVEMEFPEVTVSTLAYLETVKLPENIRPRDNVAIRLCNDKCSWPHPFTPVRRHEEMAQIAGDWAGVCKKLHVWDYNVNFSHYPAPMPNLDVIADNIRFWVECHAEALMTQGAYQSTAGERDLLRSWVIAQLMWNPELELDDLVQDFIWGYFGVAAPYILEYTRHLDTYGKMYRKEIDNGIGIRYPMNSAFLRNGFVEGAEAIYRKALQASSGDPVICRRVERDFLSILYVKISQYQGEGDPEYFATIDYFERIARAVGVTHVGETPKPGLDWQLQVWRELNGSSMVKVSPPGGTHNSHIEVEVSTHMGAVRLFYSLDGSTPNLRSREICSGEKITIKESCTLKIAMFMTGSCVGSVIGEYVFKVVSECKAIPATEVLEMV